MMKKIYFCETNGYNMVISVDINNNCRYLTEMDEFPYIINLEQEEKEQVAKKFLEAIQDDSDWKNDCTYITYSKECHKAYVSKRITGRKWSDEVKQKMSQSAKGRDVTKLQQMGTQAAKDSPNSGRFTTNVNAKDWHLIDPNGQHYYFHSLRFWLRENCREKFDCEPDSKQFYNVCSGLAGAKRAVMGKNYTCCTYKGWQVIPTKSDNNNSNNDIH